MLRALRTIALSLPLLAIGASAAELKEREFCPGLLAPELEIASVAPIGEMSLRIDGRFKGSKDVHYLGYVQWDTYMENGHRRFEINHVEVEPEFRGKGVQTVLYSEMLRHLEKAHGRKMRWKLYNLTDLNGDVFYRELLARMKARFPRLKMRALPEAEPWAQGFRAQWENEFDACCRAFAREHPAEMEPLLWEAVKATPAYRSRERFGYAKICPGTKIELAFSSSVAVYLCR